MILKNFLSGMENTKIKIIIHYNGCAYKFDNKKYFFSSLEDFPLIYKELNLLDKEIERFYFDSKQNYVRINLK